MTSEGGGAARREQKHCCTLIKEKRNEKDKPDIQTRVK